MSRLVFVGGRKGGSGKTTTALLLCLGAILRGQPATYVLTDPDKELKTEGRPFGVVDGRDPGTLAQIITNNANVLNGWLIVDGGGNRPAFDAKLAELADLCLIPFADDDEMTDTMRKDLLAMPEALGWPVNWPTNKMAATSAQRHIDKLAEDFPLRIIDRPVFEVRSTKELLGKTLDNPSTAVRAAARRAFDIVAERFDELNQAPERKAAVA